MDRTTRRSILVAVSASATVQRRVDELNVIHTITTFIRNIMTSPRKRAVREPIQVCLARPDRELLDRLAEQTGLSRAEILRRGLRRVGAELMAADHPALRFLEQITGDE